MEATVPVREHTALLKATADFRIEVADTPEKREAAYRLRYQVYCTERGYESCEGRLETDRFDDRAGHALLTQLSTGRVVGTVRLVAPASVAANPSGLDVPMQRVCPPGLFRALPRALGEISRFAISKELRDDPAGALPLRLGLLRGIVELSANMQLTAWCAIMERSLLRLLRFSGVHFHPLGPAIEHRGLRQPSWGRIDEVLGRMWRECPAVWHYITDGGALWPCAAEPAAVAVA
jgi:N-acyl-L-homoserine lactone synthetase